MNNIKYVVLALLSLVLAGCAGQSGPKETKKTNEGRYKVTKDYGPNSTVDVSHVKDAIPIVEAKSRGGNRAEYQVFGKKYQVLDSALGYKESGGASWYGKKFHGYLTANGDKYDMYEMSAAHKSLPLPSYVQVTNLANNKKVIVRVNDRGPFHQGRIIDLSYAAASKLDMLGSGTAQVEVIAIDPLTWNKSAVSSNTAPKTQFEQSDAVSSTVVLKPFVKIEETAPELESQTVVKEMPAPATKTVTPQKSEMIPSGDLYKEIHYIQVGVYSTEQAALDVTGKMKQFELPALVSEVQQDSRSLYKVILGPVPRRSVTEQLKAQLDSLGYAGAHLVDLP